MGNADIARRGVSEFRARVWCAGNLAETSAATASGLFPHLKRLHESFAYALCGALGPKLACGVAAAHDASAWTRAERRLQSTLPFFLQISAFRVTAHKARHTMSCHRLCSVPSVRGTAPARRCVHGSPFRTCVPSPHPVGTKRGALSRVGLFGRREPSGSAEGGAKSSSSPNSTEKNLTPFPKDYDQLIAQCQKSLQRALDDDVPLMEIQFPPGGLDSVAGDVEGNTENNLTTLYLRGICAQFERNKTARTTRVFFPDPTELDIALCGASNSPDGIGAPDNASTKATFADWPGPCDFLEAPDFLSVSGLDKLLNKRVSLSDTTKAKAAGNKDENKDSCFVVAYPSLNISELVRTKELFDGERGGIDSGQVRVARFPNPGTTFTAPL